MPEPNRIPLEIDNLIHFFHNKKSKYIFVILDDERILNQIVEPIIAAYEKKGKEILHVLLKQHDYYIFQQVRRLADSGPQGIIVTGLNELIEEYGDICIDNLNRSRDAFQKIAIPIIWIIDHKSLQKIIRGASDFYQMRHLPDFHILETVEIDKPLMAVDFFYNPYPGDKDIDPSYLEKQLDDIPPAWKHEKETINGFVIPLLRRYLDLGEVEKMISLYRRFIAGYENKVNDTYILVSYYTAIGELHRSPLFPRHFMQPVAPGDGASEDELPHVKQLGAIIARKNGVIVALGADCANKRRALHHTLAKLGKKGFDFITIYGETTPELVLFYMAVKAKEKNDEAALEIFSSSEAVEIKARYFIDTFFSRYKIAVIFRYFEKNQLETAGGECKSRRLRSFLNLFHESLKGKDSFFLISTSLPIGGFTMHIIHDDPETAVIRHKLDELTPNVSRVLDVLSIFHKPVYPEVLRFFDIDPGDLETFQILAEKRLLQTIIYTDNKNTKETRLYVSPFISHLVQEKSDRELEMDYHLKAGRYFEDYSPAAESSYLEQLIEARRHYIAAKKWDKAAELTLKLFWPLHNQNYIQWALDLLIEIELENIDSNLKYQIHRRLGLLCYYRGSYIHSWEHYREALALVKDEDDRYRLYSEILPVENSANPGFNSYDKSIFKGIFHSLPVQPPPEIIQAGSSAILRYFNEIKLETTYLLECKVLLVGAGGVGKTTLMKKLMDNNLQVIVGTEETTRGIAIIPWELPCTYQDGKTAPVKLYFLDFGGQDIMYTTHQFFLTKRSLYLFVWEARLETQKTDAFDYWLNIIKLLSDNSPVLIVMNKADVRIRAIDEASIQDKFKNIQAFLRVSCLTGAGIPELTEQIRASLAKMPHLQDKLPKAWLDIREDLKKRNKDYISLEEYFEICARRGLNRERAYFLSDYLHDLGVILHFRVDPLLENTVILNPEWATHAVHRIMDTIAILENKGRFKRTDLKTLWDENIFPVDKHPQLLRLMERFELCFPEIGSDIYIVPELLPAEKPALDFDKYNRPGNLHFEYHYEFMPWGILSRFISRLYYMICDDHFWKIGVELILDKTYALVLSESLRRKLSVSVWGDDKIDLLAIIRHHLEYIHRSLNMKADEHYREMIPCKCAACRKTAKPHMYDYQVLKRFISKNILHIQCGESGDQVLIDGLLKGFAPPSQKTDLKELLAELIKSAARLHVRAKTIRTGEDDRNSFIAELLTARGYIVKDRISRGSVFSRKAPGEIDMLIEMSDGNAVSVIEAFNLKNLNRSLIARHFQKLFMYDASGLENNYLLVYAESDDFDSLWRKYLEYLPEVDVKYKLTAAPEEEQTHYKDIKLARTKHNRHDRETVVYHIFINMKI